MSECEHHDYTMVEDYIRGLQWSPAATDHEKSLVAGNIRGFYEHARGLITPPQPADGGYYRDKALAWDAVCVALNHSFPGWATDGNKTGLESAVATIHKLAGADGEDRVELAELIEAAKAISDMYTHAWDLTDGGLLMMASSVPRFEERHAALTAALAKFQPAGGES